MSNAKSESRNETPEERALNVLRHFEVLVSKRYNGSISIQAYSEEVDRLVKVLCATPSETAPPTETVLSRMIAAWFDNPPKHFMKRSDEPEFFERMERAYRVVTETGDKA